MSEPIDPELEENNNVDSEAGNDQTVDQAFSDDESLDPSAAGQPESRDEEMERLRRTAAEADKRVLQAQAEAENFRKRMRRDFESQIKFASTDLVIDLLQVRDNLNRAIEAAENSGQTDALKEGVAIVAKQMDDVFGKHGVTEIPAAGETFDPNLHEAISQMPSPDVESGKVAHVAQSGFRLHDRVIRPSQVVVSTGPAS
ncbi:nucleotide exchange factor GrpE [Roseiconus lacunae]|uniref:Protein GrpE n=1 Tax=Roseiconus lacunae TaxID=2605694 RepID=A0ABT7PIX6_9BACT|nr:nucleotide exchange factor GrpE [Roseiconus lacunae]MCD0458564.1 nucleotide exchange factor GrpE [Roseiconus lacunae]MDM4016452.1 nucleotide exchange factor GrpE [Roseiconus lacunae]WRQ51947.1 nucleotide exchange factor GrpE [Stieleria sp. HD01]